MHKQNPGGRQSGADGLPNLQQLAGQQELFKQPGGGDSIASLQGSFNDMNLKGEVSQSRLMQWKVQGKEDFDPSTMAGVGSDFTTPPLDRAPGIISKPNSNSNLNPLFGDRSVHIHYHFRAK